MAIKWSGWTRRTGVKVCAWLLLLSCIFSELLLFSRMMVFVDSNEFINYNYYGNLTEGEYAGNELYHAYEYAVQVALFGSEDMIRDEMLLHPEYAPSGRLAGLTCAVTGFNLAGSFFNEYEVVQVPSFYDNGEYYVEQLRVAADDAGARLKATQQQLEMFRQALRELESSGYAYYIDSGYDTYSGGGSLGSMDYTATNVEGQFTTNTEDFQRWDNDYTNDSLLREQGCVIELGMRIDGFNRMQQKAEASRQVVRTFVLNSLFLGVVALGALLVITLSAGRRKADGGAGLHFTTVDSVYLDLGLFLIFTFLAFLVGSYIWLRQWLGLSLEEEIMVISCGLTLYPCLPLLCWYVNLVKRFKAGGWWRHTLIWSFFSWIRQGGRSFRRRWSERFGRLADAWSGCANKEKIFIGTGVFGVLALFSFLIPGFFLLAMLICGLFLYRHYNDLDELEQLVCAVERGEYSQQGGPRRGDYRRIVQSVRDISQGLDDAVRLRMRSERMKTELITNVSHDLRTPLTSMVTYTDLLKTEGLDHPKAPEYLEVLIQKTNRLKLLTDELFEAAKAASGSLEVHLEQLDFAQLIRQCLGELDEKVRESRLDFRVTIPDTATVTADGRMLWRVMENLFSNVFKYALEGSRVYLELSEEAGRTRMELKNISADPLNVSPSELTERFKRGDESRHTEGSGLGLSIVQSFVEAQGGSFSLEIDGDLFKAIVLLDRAGPQGVSL